jgi:hypothetical protein
LPWLAFPSLNTIKNSKIFNQFLLKLKRKFRAQTKGKIGFEKWRMSASVLLDVNCWKYVFLLIITICIQLFQAESYLATQLIKPMVDDMSVENVSV